MAYINIGDHRFLQNDHLDDCAQNISYWLNQYAGVATGTGQIQQSSTVAASAGIANTDTLITPSIPLLAGTTFKVGSRVRATMLGTCTSSNADAGIFTLRAGILGTVADASFATATVTSAGSGSAVAFRAVIEFTVRTLGATGTASGSLAVSNTGITGIAAVTNTVVPFTSSTLATTTATFLDISYISGASTTTTTFQSVSVEIIP